MFKYLLTIVFGAIALHSVGQSNQLVSRLDDLSTRLVEEQVVPGVEVLLLKDGELLYNKAFGYADVAQKRPLKTGDIFRIASQTKAITSVAVMILWEQGKILLDDPISKYFPSFRDAQVLDTFNPADSSYTTNAAHKQITIRDLLRHTSGIGYPIITDDARMQAIYKKAGVFTGIGNKGTLQEKMALLAQQPLLHEPNTAFTYGLNTDLLGALVETVSGMPLDEFLRTHIFDPLEMKDTQFSLPQDKAHRLVTISEKTDNGFIRVEGPIYDGSSVNYPLQDGIYLSGGAGLTSTTADYAKFLQMLLHGGLFKDKRILSAKTIGLMTTNQLSQTLIADGDPDFRFGLGFELVTPDNKFLKSTSIGTFSWGGAFNTHYWVDPHENIVGLVFTQMYFSSSYDDLHQMYKNVIYSNLP